MASERNIFLALDGEMSSPNFAEGGALIQIGAYGAINSSIIDDADNARKFESPISFENGLWEETAESIHGISLRELDDAPTAEDVDDLFYGWLLSIGAKPNRRLITPVGMNVGAFDMLFVNKFLPRSAELFTRRCVDVNGVCFSMDGIPYMGEPKSSAEWKSLSLEYGRKQWRIKFGDANELSPHDALFDAWVQGFAWEFLKSGMRGVSLAMPDVTDSSLELQEKLQQLVAHFGIPVLSAKTGVPETFLKGWSIGGRATNFVWKNAVEDFYSQVG